jgi:hypothetical protein
MAITKGLFGFDPYEVQQQQTQRLLAPITQASNPYERIGASLGTILGASMFDIKDPRLAKASKITAITKQVMGEDMNPTDPELPTKLQNLSKALFDEGEVDAAMYALEQAQKFTPKKKFEKVGNQLVDVSGATPVVAFTGEDKEAVVKTSEAAARAAGELGFGVRANLSDYSEQELTAINNLLQTRGERVQAAGVPQSGQVKVTDLNTATQLVDRFVKGPQEKLSTARDARSQLILARKGEGAAFAQLQRQLVKLVGDSQIGMGEVRAALGSAGIVGNTISAVNQFMTGVPSADKLDSVEQVINALEDINAQSYNSGRKRAESVLNEANLSEGTRKSLIPPAYKTGREKKTGGFVEGKIYKDAKGNRARYVNGKWEPVQ